MSPLASALLVAGAVFGVSAPALLLVRWRCARRRSRLPTLAHQADGPYRKVGQKRRR